jgi:hypothetical protein
MKFHLTKAEIQQQFHLPLEEAAKALGICSSVLKKTCRHHGIKRWPYRKIKSLNKKKVSLEQSVKTFYNQYHKMKSQLEQVNKERKDILLRETGWDSLAEEQQDDHPAYHNLESGEKFDEQYEDEDRDFSDFDDEEEIEDTRSPSPVQGSSIETSHASSSGTVPSQSTQSSPSLNVTPSTNVSTNSYQARLWNTYHAADTRHVRDQTIIGPPSSPNTHASLFKIPSIADLLASVDVQVQQTTQNTSQQQMQAQPSYISPHGQSPVVDSSPVFMRRP